MTTVQLAEWEWPSRAPLPHVHAAEPRRAPRSSCRPSWPAARWWCCRSSTPPRCSRPSRGTGSARPCWCRACSTRSWTTPTPHPRPVQPRDDLLRRRRDQPGAARRGGRAVRPDLRAVLRPVRGADGHHLLRQGRPPAHATSSPPAAGRARSCARPCSARTTSRWRRGSPGEICVAGPLLAGGYWNLPDETAETFRDGWLRTGDVAREDEDGFWYIVDRTKDMIVTGGFNVFPREVEDVVAEHPAVAQVGVIGVPDEKWGEAVTAVVVLRDGRRRRRPASASPRRSRRGQGAQGLGARAQARRSYADALPLTRFGQA